MNIPIPSAILTVQDFVEAQAALTKMIQQEDNWRRQVAASMLLRAFWDNPLLEQLVAYEDGSSDMTLGGFFAVPITQQDQVGTLDGLCHIGLEPELVWSLYDKPLTRQNVVERVKQLFYTESWTITWQSFVQLHQIELAA